VQNRLTMLAADSTSSSATGCTDASATNSSCPRSVQCRADSVADLTNLSNASRLLLRLASCVTNSQPRPPCQPLTCQPLTCQPLTCQSLTCQSLACQSLICQPLTCQSVTCQSLTCQSVTCQSLACQSLTCQSLIRQPLTCRSLAYQ